MSPERTSGSRLDAIVIGAGINGLVTAAELARQGRKVLVLERRTVLGGTAATEELFPGCRVDSCRLDPGWIPERMVRELDLVRHGLEISTATPGTFAPRCDASALVLGGDATATLESIRRHSPADAAKWGAFTRLVARLAGFLEALYSVPPPEIASNAPADLLTLLGLGRRLRGLGKEGMIDLLRILPMSVADLLDEWFESDALKSALAVRGVTEILQGPRSGGTAFLFLHHHVGAPGGVWTHRVVRGGIGGIADALARSARAHGAEIRTGAEVARIIVRDGRATGVALTTGEELAARAIVSSADPARTLDGLIDPVHLDPELSRAVQHIKFRGASARVHLLLGELPRFAHHGPAGAESLGGAIVIASGMDDLERAYDAAKHGEISPRPWLEATIPTVHDPSRAPAGRHVLSVRVQWAPYHLGDGGWTDERREALGDLVIDTLAEYAPNLRSAILDRRVFTPADLEGRFAITEGSVPHGELTLDQILFMRPVPECARYRTPIDDLYLCGAGTHPGGGLSGASGVLAARAMLHDARHHGRARVH